MIEQNFDHIASAVAGDIEQPESTMTFVSFGDAINASCDCCLKSAEVSC